MVKRQQVALPTSGYRLPGLSTLEAKEFSCRQGKPTAQRQAHWHNEIEINFLTRGTISYLWHGRLEPITAPALVLFWGGMPHQVIEARDDPECFWIYIPLAWFLQWHLPKNFTQAVLSGRLVENEVADRMPPLLGLARQWRRDLRQNDPELNAIVLLEIQAQVGRLARGIAAGELAPLDRSRRELRGPVDRLEAMVNYMATHFQDRLIVGQIAEAADLHPNYACSLFKKACGITLHAYLTQLRISHAQRTLVTTDRTVLDIAADAGFGSASRFYEAFKASCALSPDAFRKKHLAEA